MRGMGMDNGTHVTITRFRDKVLLGRPARHPAHGVQRGTVLQHMPVHRRAPVTARHINPPPFTAKVRSGGHVSNGGDRGDTTGKGGEIREVHSEQCGRQRQHNSATSWQSLSRKKRGCPGRTNTPREHRTHARGLPSQPNTRGHASLREEQLPGQRAHAIHSDRKTPSTRGGTDRTEEATMWEYRSVSSYRPRLAPSKPGAPICVRGLAPHSHSQQRAVEPLVRHDSRSTCRVERSYLRTEHHKSLVDLTTLVNHTHSGDKDSGGDGFPSPAASSAARRAGINETLKVYMHGQLEG